MGGGPTYVEGAKGNAMSPGEIRACYRLYAAHRKSHEICAFPNAILANDISTPAELAALHLHTCLEGLAREVAHCAATEQLSSQRCEHLSRK